MSAVLEKRPHTIPSYDEQISLVCLDIINRNLESPDSPPTKETIWKISIDDELVDNSQKEEILRYMIMMSSLKTFELRPLWAHLRQQYVVTTFNKITAIRRQRELCDWRARWADS